MNDFETKWTFKNQITLDTLENDWPTLRIFKKDLSSELPTHLAHAIAAQTHRDTKAMARAKTRIREKPNEKY
jgi:hypothetical protein